MSAHDEHKVKVGGTSPPLTTAPSPTLPKGGGAIRGMGEKFSTNAFTGTGRLVVPIPTSPARADFSPHLQLEYDAGTGNGPFGTGWRLAVPRITRKIDKRLPEYRDADDSDVFVLAGMDDLVPDPTPVPPRDGFTIRRYRPRIEGAYARIERREVASGDFHFVVVTSDNVQHVYGRGAAARISDGGRVFSWLLERSEDAFGNVISYVWIEEDLAGVAPSPAELHRTAEVVRANRYLKRIRYGNLRPGDDTDMMFEVVFDYGDHDPAAPGVDPTITWPARPDAFSTYKPGFEVRTYRLCRRVLMFHHFAELGGDCLVHAVRLGYDERPTLTRLVSIVHEGHAADGPALATPPITLAYTEPTLDATVREVDAAALPEHVDGLAQRWVDLDGEGLPGVMTDDGGTLWYQRNLGGGALAAPQVLVTRPAMTALTGGHQQLMSLGGDGALDLVAFGPPVPGYHERTGVGWAPFQPFAADVVIDFASPDVRFLDLDGDGLDDIVIAGEDVFTWYPSRGKQGFGPPRTFPRPLDDDRSPAVVFADEEHAVFLADLSGDGLRDLVRIENGSVCYWPNLGFGRFGAKITMAAPPVFDLPDQFTARRILFADIDGSGTTDLLYVGRDGVRMWMNQAGNSWSEASEVPGLRIDSQVRVTATDVLGTGTACLAWSSPLPADAGRLAYVDLLASTKPHLLASIDNGLGSTMRMRYAPSTKFYLADRAAGRPWTTRLPFPVHVLERLEAYDTVSRVLLVSELRYANGYFDPYEREFRGFGYVAQTDTESDPALFGAGLFADRPPPVNGTYVQPPVIRETWFHQGVWLDDGPPGGLAPTIIGAATPAESRDAFRALKGQVLRSTIRVEDGSEAAARPYQVTENGCEVRRVQAAVGDAPAVFATHVRESLETHSERDSSTARVVHTIAASVDECGHVRASVSIGYPSTVPGARDEQRALTAVLTETDVANVTDEDTWYRHGVPLEGRTYELTGIPSGPVPFEAHTVIDAVTAAAEIAYDEPPGAGPTKRLVERSRTRYYDSQALPAPLAWDTIDARAIRYETYGLALTPSLVASLFGGRVDDAMLAAGGYLQLDGDWWVPSGRAEPALPFYLPVRFHDAFRETATAAYDDYQLLVREMLDIKGNHTRVDLDYRTLAPRQVTDANGNRSSVEVDALGRVIATRVMGKVGSSDGDPTGEPTTKFAYTFFDGVHPSTVHAQARETHGDPATRWQQTYVYADGAGREVMKKTEVAPERGTATPRWVGSGRTVFDNKGNPIKQFEPYFAATPAYETDDELVAQGEPALHHYDALGRLVATEFPDGSVARRVFAPWEDEEWDADDTVSEAGNAWYAAHATSGDAMWQRAAQLSAANAATPARTLYDTLGRPFAKIADNGGGKLIEHRSTLDVEGNPLVVWDALGRPAVTSRYDMLGQACHQTSIDAGDRWALVNALGAPYRSWDGLGHATEVVRDELQRVTELRIDGHVHERTEYGEDAPAPEADNLRTRIHRIHDAAGIAVHESYDFKGNLASVTRQLLADPTAVVDWTSPPALGETFSHVTEVNALGLVTRAVTPDGSVTRPSYDIAGRIVRVEVDKDGSTSVHVASIDYDAKSQRSRIEYPGAHTDYTYDPHTFRLTDLTTTASDGRRLQALHYTFDALGNVVSVEDGAAQEAFFDGTVTGGTALYRYDAIHRLIHAEGREQTGGIADAQRDERSIPAQPIPHPNDGNAVRPYSEDYTYDDAGNLQTLQHTTSGAGAWTRHYTYLPGTNRLATTNRPGDPDAGPFTAPYVHDANGCMVQMPHLPQMDWTAKHELQRVDRLGGGTVYFAYDASGERVRKVWEHGAIVEERIYLGGYEIYRRRESGTLAFERQTLHVMDGVRRIALVETATVDTHASQSATVRRRYQLANHLGSACLEIDEAGAVISYREYHPYGTLAYRAVRGDIDVSESAYGYTGKELDEETGLGYFGARYYAPWLGRWTSADSIGVETGANLFVYVEDNPVNLHDPDGHQSRPPPGAVLHMLEPNKATGKAGSYKAHNVVVRGKSRPPAPAPEPGGNAGKGAGKKPPANPGGAGAGTGTGPKPPTPAPPPADQPGGQPGGKAGGHGTGTTGGGDGTGSHAERTALEKAAREAALASGLLNFSPTFDEGGSEYGNVMGMNKSAHASAGGQLIGAVVQGIYALLGGQIDKQLKELTKAVVSTTKNRILPWVEKEAYEKLAAKFFPEARNIVANEAKAAGKKLTQQQLDYAAADLMSWAFKDMGHVGPYDGMTTFTRGFKGKFQAHHVVPVEVIERLGLGNAERAPAIILTGAEHEALHKTLNQLLAGATTRAQAEKILVDFYTKRGETHLVDAVRGWFKLHP